MSQKSSVPWVRGRGLERLLARETNISDLIQFLSDRDATPWIDLVGFRPDDVVREASKSENKADLRLIGSERDAAIEVKLGHSFSTDQQGRYEAIATRPDLYLAALASDQDRLLIEPSGRWTFLNLSQVMAAWEQSEDGLARLLAHEAATALHTWDQIVAGVFMNRTDRSFVPMASVTQKFLARVITRRMSAQLCGRGYLSCAGVTSGGGLPLVQAWVPIRGEGDDRCFIAELRCWETKPGGEIRFGVDFDPRPGCSEDEEVRRAAYDLAVGMKAAIDFEGLSRHLQAAHPELARLLHRDKPSRPRATGDWEQVIVNGFKGPESPPGGRRRTKPEFYGDGALRHEAIANVNFEEASALQLVELLDVTLSYLAAQQP